MDYRRSAMGFCPRNKQLFLWITDSSADKIVEKAGAWWLKGKRNVYSKILYKVLINMNIFDTIYIEINCNVITVLVWVKTLWTTVGGRISRHFFYLKYLRLWGNYMSELSIFIDESGILVR